MPFDYKKEYKEFYRPSNNPSIIKVPKMNFLAIRGKGNPNDVGGNYQKAIQSLYAIAYTIKMSYKGTYKIDGFFEYVVPPLEGFWWQLGIKGVDSTKKDKFEWIALIRLPEFVKQADFNWAILEATNKKKKDFSNVEYFTYDEGLCVQCMHIGSYDEEIETALRMEQFARNEGFEIDISENRHHHEIYISDPRKVDVTKMKTILRHPIKKK